MSDIAQTGRASSRQGAVLLGLLAYFAILSSCQIYGIHAPFSDFRVYYEAAQRSAAHQPIYVPGLSHPYGYSPLLAYCLRPLTRLPFETADKLWVFSAILLLAASVGVYARAAGLRAKNAVAIGIMLLIGFRTAPSVVDLIVRNCNMLLLFMLCCIFYAESRERPYAQAAIIALAALFKFWMLGLLLYLAWRRRPAAALFGAGLFCAALTMLFVPCGFREMGVFFQLQSGYAAQKLGQVAVFFSIPGLGHMLFARNIAVRPLFESHAAFSVFTVVLAGALLLGFARVVVRRSQIETGRRLELAFWVMTMLLLLPNSELHYFALGLPVFWELLAIGQCRSENRPPAGATAICGLSCLLFLLPVFWSSRMNAPLTYAVNLTRYGAIFLLWMAAGRTLLRWSSETARVDAGAQDGGIQHLRPAALALSGSMWAAPDRGPAAEPAEADTGSQPGTAAGSTGIEP
jgi:hypothetical protein